MYRLRVSGESVSSCCSIRSMFSVVTPRICVSPRSNSAEPCGRGRTSTSGPGGRVARGGAADLRLAPLEQRRAVRARQHLDLGAELADVAQPAAVDPGLVAQ